MPLTLLPQKKIDKNTGLFGFKRLKDQFLLTNEAGEYMFLNPSEFNQLVFYASKAKEMKKYDELCEKGFIKNDGYLDRLIQKYARKNSFFNDGTVLHIVVVTLKCNNRCLYCQTSAGLPDEKSLDMTVETAKNVVDRIFESPNPSLTIEFQGGEPLMNFDTIKFIVSYAKEKNNTTKKRIKFSLVSNFSFLTEEKLSFLMDENISLCTSLDGPRTLHNKNRIALGKGRDSYKDVMEGLRKINAFKPEEGLKSKPNALLTVTKESLKYPREIIDEYIKAGLDKIFLRPLNIFNFSEEDRKRFQYPPGAFLEFYKNAMDYILDLNFKGKIFQECTAYILLVKILKGLDPNFLDLRSPCGAGIGQLAYDYNGDIYTCDEGRMMARRGDKSFRLGCADESHYDDLINSSVVKSMCIASCLDNLAGCVDCVYKPYCGVCPLMKYAEGGSIFSYQLRDFRCAIYSGILDYLFEKLQDHKCVSIFQKWLSLP